MRSLDEIVADFDRTMSFIKKWKSEDKSSRTMVEKPYDYFVVSTNFASQTMLEMRLESVEQVLRKEMKDPELRALRATTGEYRGIVIRTRADPATVLEWIDEHAVKLVRSFNKTTNGWDPIVVEE